MLPSNLDALLREHLTTDLKSHSENIESTRTGAVERAHHLGNHPGTLVTMDLIGEAGRHMKATYDSISEVVGQVGFEPYDNFSEDLVSIYDEFTNRQISQIRQSLDSWHGEAHNPQIDRNNDLKGTFSNLQQSFRVKVRTLAAAVLHPVSPTVMTSIKINNSSVGAVTTGDNNQVHFTMSVEDRNSLDADLKLIREHLGTLDAEVGAELGPILEETETELSTEKPNKLKLRGLLTSIATTIKNVGTLNTSYVTIAKILETLGVTIPN